MNQRNFKKEKEEYPEPTIWDAVAGNANNISDNRAVLGGLPGLLEKWKSKDLKIQISAINNAHNYGIEGLRLLIEATWNSDKEIRKKAARRLADKQSYFINLPTSVDGGTLFQECEEILYHYKYYSQARTFFEESLKNSFNIWAELYQYLSEIKVSGSEIIETGDKKIIKEKEKVLAEFFEVKKRYKIRPKFFWGGLVDTEKENFPIFSIMPEFTLNSKSNIIEAVVLNPKEFRISIAQCIESSLSESYIRLIVKYSNFPDNWQLYDLVCSLQRTAADYFKVSRNETYNQVGHTEARYQKFRALQIIKSLVVDWEGFIKELLPSESAIEQFFLVMNQGYYKYKVKKFGDNYICYEIQEDYQLGKYAQILGNYLGVSYIEVIKDCKEHRLHEWVFSYENLEYWVISKSQVEKIIFRAYNPTMNYEEIEFLFSDEIKNEKFSRLISFYLNKFSPEEDIKDWNSNDQNYVITSLFKDI